MTISDDRIQFHRRMFKVKPLDSYLAEVAAGAVPNARSYQINGYNSAITGTLSDVSELGVTTIPLPAAPTAMEIVSTDATDTAAGVGAQSVEIHGLIAGYLEASEVIVTNGLTPVPTVNEYVRINNYHVKTAGSTGVAVGDIKLQSVGGAVQYNKVTAGGNMCLQGLFTIPAGTIGYIHEVTMGSTTTSVNTIARVLFRSKADWHDRSLTTAFLFEKIGVYQKDVKPYPVGQWYPAMCDIKISAQTIQGSAAAVASGNFNLYLFDLPV